MKELYFGDPIPEILVEGRKGSTFRLSEDQDIRKGDLVSFLLPNGNEFARVVCTETKKTRLGDLTEQDWRGHERFESDVEMLRVYSTWEKRAVKMDDPLKIIRFRYLSFKKKPVLEYLGGD